MKRLFRYLFWLVVAVLFFSSMVTQTKKALDVQEYRTCISMPEGVGKYDDCEQFLKGE